MYNKCAGLYSDCFALANYKKEYTKVYEELSPMYF